MKIISGGQTGADRGGLDAAIELGIEHGGHCPLGRTAEDGVIPNVYLLQESRSTGYPQRTEYNVKNAGVTIIFNRSEFLSGGQQTHQAVMRRSQEAVHGCEPFRSY